MSVYTNDGFTLIENLVREVSGRSYVQFVEDEILHPIGMNHSRFPTVRFNSNEFAHGSAGQSQEILNAYGSGGLYSTPSDMLRFAKIFINSGWIDGIQVISSRSVQEMGSDQTQNQFNPVRSESLRYGLGWDTVDEPGLAQVGVLGWTKGGDTQIYGSALLIAPNEKMAVFLTGTLGMTSTKCLSIAEKILLNELAARGRIRQVPSLIALEVQPEKLVNAQRLDAMTGVWGRSGSSDSLLKTDQNARGGIALKFWNGSQWETKLDDLRFRADGWFTSAKEPKASLSLVWGDGRDYLALRQISGFGQYWDQQAFAQRLMPIGELSFSWQERIGKTWINVNLSPELPVGLNLIDPRLRLTEVKNLEGYVVVELNEIQGPGPSTPTQLQKSFAILDPTQSEEVARPTLWIHPMASRDQDTLTVFARNGESWLRYGSYVFRPIEKVPSINRGSSKKIIIGPEGYAEWLKANPSSQSV